MLRCNPHYIMSQNLSSPGLELSQLACIHIHLFGWGVETIESIYRPMDHRSTNSVTSIYAVNNQYIVWRWSHAVKFFIDWRSFHHFPSCRLQTQVPRIFVGWTHCTRKIVRVYKKLKFRPMLNYIWLIIYRFTVHVPHNCYTLSRAFNSKKTHFFGSL